MGKLFLKTFWTSQDRLMKGQSHLPKPIKEVHITDTSNGIQIARADSEIFGETL